MQVKPLSTTTFEELMDCFYTSFEGYFVKMPTDNAYFKNRWKAAKVDYDLSFGMFDDDTLVGFIVNAIDYRNGIKIAYNTGTGVIPEYRGKRIVKQIYDTAIPILKKNNINTFTLEVITKNTNAIKAYEFVGFEICKTYKCYNNTFNEVSESALNIECINSSDFDWNLSKNESYYSWDNQKEAITRNSQLSYYLIKKENLALGYVIVDTENGYIAQIEAFSNSIEDYSNILNKLSSLSLKWRINNIDDRLKEKINAFESLGFQNSIDQYEMLLNT